MSLANINPFDNEFLVSASRNATFSTSGFQTDVIPIMDFSAINISLRTTVASQIQIYAYTTQNETYKQKVFEKSLTANEHFFKRITIKGWYFSITVNNTAASQGAIFLATSGSSQNQFQAQTYLNSNIGIDADTNLVRVGNNWDTDMVRGIHQDFTKVNVQAILNEPSANSNRTIGCGDDIFNQTAAENIYIEHLNINDVSGGAGATQVNIIYVDENDVIQTLVHNLNAVAGKYNLGVQAKALHRAFVSATGVLKQNAGDITFETSTGIDTFGVIKATENTTHVGVYYVPPNNRLILRSADIAGTGIAGIIRINEYDYTQGINYSIGEFRIDSKAHNFTYNINGLIPGGNAVVVNWIPDSGAAVIKTFINVMLNAVLCPIIDDF
jgi:hypothetical protein